MKRLFSLLLILTITTFVIASVPTQSFKLETQTQTEFCISNESNFESLAIQFVQTPCIEYRIQTEFYNYQQCNSENSVINLIKTPCLEKRTQTELFNHNECNFQESTFTDIHFSNYTFINVGSNTIYSINLFAIIEKNNLKMILYPFKIFKNSFRNYPLKKPLLG